MSTTSTKTTAAIAGIAQLRSTSNKLDNLGAVAECARLAKEQGVSMLFLPECFGFIGESSDQTLKEAESSLAFDENAVVDGRSGTDSKVKNHESITKYLKNACSRENPPLPDVVINQHKKNSLNISILDGLRTIAKESGIWISGGGMHVLGAPPDEETGNQRVYNTHVILDNYGKVQAIYRKVHLFDVSIPGKVSLRESATTAPGKELVVCNSPIGKKERIKATVNLSFFL